MTSSTFSKEMVKKTKNATKKRKTIEKMKEMAKKGQKNKKNAAEKTTKRVIKQH